MNKEIKNIRAYSKLPFPHYLGAKPSEMVQKQTGTARQMVGGVMKDVPVYSKVMGNGSMNLISNPKELAEVGDLLQHPYHNNLSYEVLGIIESRPAMGDWSFVDFKPFFQQLEVKIRA